MADAFFPNLGLSLEDTSEPSTDVLDPAQSPPFMCVYDFDRTITVTHVHNDILKRKSQHSDGGGDDDDSEVFIQMGACDYLKQYISEEEVITWFGSQERRDLLRKHLDKMKNTIGVECRILTLNDCETVQTCLQIANLSEYFTKICGQDTAEFIKLSRKKSALLKRWRRANHLGFDDLIFVDDDPKNIKSVNTDKVCLTVRVGDKEKDAWGMKRVHFRSIESHFKQRKQKLAK